MRNIIPLVAWRDKNGLTQTKAAEMLNVSRQTFIRYEKGIRTPPQPYMDRIVILTDGAVTANDWLGEEAGELIR